MTDGGKCRGRESPRMVEVKVRDEPIDDPSIIPEKFAKKLRGKMGS